MSGITNAKCVECSKEKRGTAKSKECFKGQACMKKLSYYRNHEHNKLYMRTRLYGITEQVYKAMLVSQYGKCAICGWEFSDDVKPVIDHNHTTNKVRALICSNCNNALGMVRESVDVMEKMIAYVKLHS